MAAIYLYGQKGRLIFPADASTTVLVVDPALAGAIALNFYPGAYTYLSITAGPSYELVKVTGVYGDNLVVERGQSSPAQSFPSGAILAFEVTAAAIEGDITTPPNIAAITGTGQAQVTSSSPNVFTVHVPTPFVVGGQGIEITGTWPNITINVAATDCCGAPEPDEGGGVGVTSLQGQGIVQAYAIGPEGYVKLDAPVFTGSGVTITGSWPNYTFTVASGAGGTVTSVAAAAGGGLVVTGTPAIAPQIGMANTGVAAGTYGGVTINAKGQITAVPGGFNPISAINVTLPLVATPSLGAVALNVNNATFSARGVVTLVDDTDPFDPLNTTDAMTPAAVQKALDTLTESDVTGNSSYTSEADGLYVNTVGGSATAFQLAAGEKAIVIATATVTNNTDPLDAHVWGLAVFNATPLKLKANKSIKQIHQSLIFTMTGPVSVTSLAIVTTDLTGATLLSYDLEILKL